MRKMVATALITAAVLAAVAGAVYGGAAAVGLGGVDRLGGGGVAVTPTTLGCGSGSGLVSSTVICATAP